MHPWQQKYHLPFKYFFNLFAYGDTSGCWLNKNHICRFETLCLDHVQWMCHKKFHDKYTGNLPDASYHICSQCALMSKLNIDFLDPI